MKKILFAAMTVILLLAATGCKDIMIGPNHDKGEHDSYITYPPYLTFKGNEAFTLGLFASKQWDGKVEYSTDKTNWTVWNGSTISSASSDGSNYIYLRGRNKSFTKNLSTTFSLGGNPTLEVECTGNIMTLLDYSNPDTVEMADWCFSFLFAYCRKLTKAPDLPATTLTQGCYNYMFATCEALKAAPALPATKLAKACYTSMFSECKALTTAPSLPAKTLADNCYSSMFYNCSALTAAPSLPATTLAASCYSGMFQNCTALTSAKKIVSGKSINVDGKSSCFANMFSGCEALNLKEEDASTAIGYFVKFDSASTEVTTNCANMFYKTKGFSGTPSAGKAYRVQ